tara:strand:+ start:601 stop:1068 length:468 start_codon:yes stop_codon:yes gene_type:complete
MSNILDQIGGWTGVDAASIEDFALREAAKKAGIDYDGRTFSRKAGGNAQVNELIHSMQNNAGITEDQGVTANNINPSQPNFVPFNFSIDADSSGLQGVGVDYRPNDQFNISGNVDTQHGGLGVQGSYQPNKNVKIDFNYDTRQGPGIYGGGNLTF